MDQKNLKTLAAYDVTAGQTAPVSEAWPEPKPKSKTGYRWLHLDINDPATRPWAADHMPDIAARALLQSETRPRCERIKDGLILNLRGVNLNPDSDPEDMVSLRLWVTQDAIISARIRKVWAIDTIRQSAEQGTAPATQGAFLAELVYGLTSRIEKISLGLEEQTDELEETVSQGQRLAAGQLSRIRQAVIKMRRFINPQREAVTALAALNDWIIAPDELALIGESANRTRRVVEELDATRERLSALQDHIDAERAHALGRNSYVLSVVAAIFLPLGFLTGLFGVNVAGMPGMSEPSAFWILTAVSALLGVGLFLIFKFSKWL